MTKTELAKVRNTKKKYLRRHRLNEFDCLTIFDAPQTKTNGMKKSDISDNRTRSNTPKSVITYMII